VRLYDDLHMVVADRDFADLFPARGRPAEAPVRLALATRAAVSLAVALGAAALLAGALGLQGTAAIVVLVLGAVLTMMTTFTAADPTTAGRAITQLCLPGAMRAGFAQFAQYHRHAARRGAGASSTPVEPSSFAATTLAAPPSAPGPTADSRIGTAASTANGPSTATTTASP